ncbi:exosome complex protein Rrp42 [Candidatus Bathyarchaeota archaeon]|nr:MAG: RNA-binding protein [archaeon 13_2_20CM_2_53_6]TMI27166.1 MAG: exosome complex protein Rrp42 [Candidatus Bathyarchaeota archaeon]
MSATPQLPPVAKLEQKTVIDLVAKGKRIDERGPESYRPIQIQVGLIEKANGSAQVHLGKSKVLAGIKVQIGTPFPDTPDEGVLTVNAELVPLASPSFEAGPPSEAAIELSRVVDRGIRESKALDMKSLVLQKGKTVQVVYVDIYVLDHDGNLIDAASMAALAALVNSKVSKMEVKGDEVINKGGHHQLPLNNYPVAVTFAKVDRTIIVDPSLEEEQVMNARLTVTIDKNGDICAMQKGGLYGFTPDEVRKAVHMAVGKAAENRARIMAAAKG